MTALEKRRKKRRAKKKAAKKLARLNRMIEFVRESYNPTAYCSGCGGSSYCLCHCEHCGKNLGLGYECVCDPRPCDYPEEEEEEDGEEENPPIASPYDPNFYGED